MTNDPCLSNDSTGTCVASYTWGEHTVTNYTTANIGNITGDVYDIIGEWQVHNAAFWMTLGTAVVGALALDPIAATAGTMTLPFTFKSGMDLNLGSSLEAEKDRWYVYYPSQILKWLNKIGSLNCLNWGD